MNENNNYKLIYTENGEYCRACEKCKSAIPYDVKTCPNCMLQQEPVLTKKDLLRYKLGKIGKPKIYNDREFIAGLILFIIGYFMVFSKEVIIVIVGIFTIYLGLKNLITGMKG